MAQFYWYTIEGDLFQVGGSPRDAAYALIRNYIKRNENKSLEELRKDLDILGILSESDWRFQWEWDGHGLYPFTLTMAMQDGTKYFPQTISLHGEEISISNQWGDEGEQKGKWEKLKKKMAEYGYAIEEGDGSSPNPSTGATKITLHAVLPYSAGVASQDVHLLRKSYQIILYGPPGTGKTYRAMKILPELLGVDEDELDAHQCERWDIVQFHPSYNYEDFVRGVKVEMVNDKIAYRTADRIFGDICKRAAQESEDKKYALIIDEINRANVSAVLGELIYALEYRGKKVQTPYAVEGDSTLVIPKNLYIIGTMNTADRTIGQIDYAVRRRFSFVHCPPSEGVIKSKGARHVFSEVKAIFDEHISPDYDASDVRIGHSYFMADSAKLARRIIYQVVPILREYIKDGVLSKEAESKISEIENNFKRIALIDNQPDEEVDAEYIEEYSRGMSFFYWEKEGRFGINYMGRTSLSIVHDYVEQNSKITLEELQVWFPNKGKETQNRGIKSAIVDNTRFFTKKGEELNVGGKPVYVTNQWVKKRSNKSGGVSSFEEFKEGVNESGYTVRHCYIVNIQEVDKKRSWDACMEFGFVSASGVKGNGQLRTIGLQKIKKGAIVFALLLTDSDKNKGFIGMGKVLEEAVPINQFKVEGTPILNYLCKDGEKYRKKYPAAAEHANDEQKREWMVRVKWLRVLPREEAEGTSTPGHVTFSKIPQSNLKIIKAKFEEDE